MATGSQTLTTYYAKRIIGDTAAADAAAALLQTGANIATNTWILDRTNRANTYGIKYLFDNTTNGTADKIEFYGGQQTDNVDVPSAWVQLDTGDLYVLGNVGIGHAPDTYKLYVNGNSYLSDNNYFCVNSGYANFGDTVQFSNTTSWNKGTLIVGANGSNKVIIGQLNSSTNGAVVGAHASTCTAWAPLYLAGTQLYIRGSEVTWAKWIDGCLSLFPTSSNYREGLRIHSVSSWSDITLCGNDNTGDTGISANSWFIGNNNGNFYIARNGSPGSTAYLSCVSNAWSFKGSLSILDGENLNIKAVSSSNDTGDIVWWYGNGNEQARFWMGSGWTAKGAPSFREYKSDGTSLYSGVLPLGDGTGASGTWGIGISGNAATATTWQTARTLTIGGTGKSVNGSANVSWSLSEIGAAAASHTHSYLPLSGGNMTGKIYSSATRILQWTTSDTDNNADGASWYGLGKFTPSGDYAWICLSNYWGISFRARDNDHVKINGNVVLNAGNYTSYTVTKTGSGASGSWGISVTGSAGSVAWGNVSGRPTIDKTTVVYQISRGADVDPIQSGYFACMTTKSGITGDWWHLLSMDWSGNDANNWISQLAIPTQNRTGVYYRSRQSSTTYVWKKLWTEGESITGAVWNDYAEVRTAQGEPGQVVYELGDDTCIPTTERLQHFAGIVSDTWGFSQGETDSAKTHIAVAGRVLACPYRNRDEYKPGDCVCAAPNGTVDIMTRNEIIRYPDRIVGTVSCVPEYEEWGGSNLEIENRPPVKVNGRIWIKVK